MCAVRERALDRDGQVRDGESGRHWRDAPRLKKRFGQHLMASDGILTAIVDAAGLHGDELVVEVGPGTGRLTRRLTAAAGHVVAVEVDPDMVATLHDALGEVPNLTVVAGDILALEVADLVGDSSYVVVANLPYNVATATIRRFLEAPRPPDRMVVMVQHEVAKSMCASAGAMNLLSVGIQLYSAAHIVRRVKPGSFYPPPKVESAIVRIDPHPVPRIAPELIPSFFRLVRAGFAERRKQIRNSLAGRLDIPATDVDSWLARSGIDPRRRAEELTIEEWRTLTELAPPGRALRS